MTHSYGSSSFITTKDGRRLHYMLNGEGNTTVVFESGMGFSRSTWGLVQPLVANHTLAVVYDRAGTGRSDPDDAPRTLSRITDDFSCLLDSLGPGPFILVGHSWGGPIVRAVAKGHLPRIRGIVLVDQSDEHCDLYFAKLPAIHFAMMRVIVPFLAWLGLYRLLSSGSGSVQPVDVSMDHRQEDFTVQAARTMVAESKPFLNELVSLRAQPLDLGDLEVSVISGTKLTWAERKIRPAIIEAHLQSVAEMNNGRWIEAAQSGHFIMFSEPQIIVDEILRMIE